jgi:hypothetical protein
VKFVNVLIVTAVFITCANTQTSNKDIAVNELRRSHPSVKWSNESATEADVTCDGKPDTVVLGSEKNTVVIGIVTGSHSKRSQVLSFPLKAGIQDGFCARPNRIEGSPLDCQSNQGPLAGCKPKKGCQSFAVIDDECDPFNFYWDSSRKGFAWWRN